MVKILSVIVAREGSNGLKSKCMLPIEEKPVVEHVIEWSTGLTNKDNKIHVDTAVSTDIKELKDISEKHGAFYIERDAVLAGDVVRIEDVMFNAVEKLDGDWDYISLLYGNIPLRYNELFYGPIEFLENNTDFDAVLSFQNVEKFNPGWMIDLAKDELPKWSEKGFRRQDLKQYMVHDGHTCISRLDYFVENYKKMQSNRTGRMYEAFGSKIKPWINGELIIDIDTERDYWLARAATFFKNSKK
jgi:CMP-N-acetylneuraminic acid synthetase